MAAITVGQIAVELTAGTGQFLKGMTKAATNARAFGRDLQSSFAKMGELLAPLGAVGEKLSGIFNVMGTSARGALTEIAKSGALLGGLSALTGGTVALGGTMFGLAEHAAEVGSRIYEASEKTGIAAEQMSGIMALTKETGGNFDALSTSLARAGANLQSAIIQPGSETGKIFAQLLGGTKQLADEGLKPMGDRIQDVLKHIFALSDAGQRNLALTKLLGRGWQENLESLRLLGTQGYGPIMEDAKRFGGFFGEKAAQQAFQFTSAMRELTAEISGVGIAIGQRAIPYFTNLMAIIAGGVPLLKSFGEKILAIDLALTGVGIHAAIKLWKDSDAEMKKSYDQQNRFLTGLNDLTKGHDLAADAAAAAASKTGAQKDGLADLIAREKDQLSVMDAISKPWREAQLAYKTTIEQINKYVAAGGSMTEAMQAQGLAASILAKRLSEIPPIVPKMADVAGLGTAAFNRFNAPQIGGRPGAFQFQPLTVAPFVTPGVVAMQKSASDSTLGMVKALREEMDLSVGSLNKLGAAFPNMTVNMIASSAAGRKMIEQLSTLDKTGSSLSEHFAEMSNSLIVGGADFGGKMADIMGHGIDQIEDKFAELVVKGKANFRELTQSIEEMFLKAGFQKIASEIFSAGQAGVNTASGASSGGGGLGALAGIGGFFSKIFGGFLAGGGDVMPGYTYAVGEKGMEFFTPTVPGTVHKSIPTGGNTVINMHIHGVPDADSFRRSQSQIMGDLHRAAAIAAARRG